MKTVTNKSWKVVLSFPPDMVTQPITYHLVKDYDLVFNILRAKVTPEEEGLLVIEITGPADAYKKGMTYLKEQGITVQPLSQDVQRNETKCVSCGACIVVCPTGALSIPDRTSMKVAFDQGKCIACELCIPACPFDAMEVHF